MKSFRFLARARLNIESLTLRTLENRKCHLLLAESCHSQKNAKLQEFVESAIALGSSSCLAEDRFFLEFQ